jgi:hypothetical protein
METDDDLKSALQSEDISDEDERKIDYYLPRVSDKVSELSEQQQETFEHRLEELFAVSLNEPAVEKLDNRLQDDIVTMEPILDLLLLSAGSTEDREGVESLLEHIRSSGIDDEQYLSGGEGGVAGYKRVVTNSYSLTDDGFNDVFQTARRLYADGASTDLLRLLEDVDRETDANIYEHDSPVEDLIVNRYEGEDRDLARRLFRTINATRIIENNHNWVLDEYHSEKKQFEETVDDIQQTLRDLENHNHPFNEKKISIEEFDVSRFETLATKADEIDSAVAKYLLGVERESRTSIFETMAYHLKKDRDRLTDMKSEIANKIDDIESLSEQVDRRLQMIDEVYDDIEQTTVSINIVDRDQVKAEFEASCRQIIGELKQDLPVVEITDNGVEETLKTWDTQISQTKEELADVADYVDRLEEFRDDIHEIETERQAIHRKFDKIESLMGGSA